MVYLPSGDAALTRRARKLSKLSAEVMKFSRARKQSERQGLLVEKDALERAEQECLADADVREKRRQRDAERRGKLDQKYVESFAKAVRERYPNCPEGVERAIAEHACEKHSGRIGRTSFAKNLENAAVDMAVVAHIRHNYTKYHELLDSGHPRDLARELIRDEIDEEFDRWR